MDFREYVRRHLLPLDAPRAPEIEDELAGHLGDLYDEGRSAGLDHDAALARAVAALPERSSALAREIEVATRALPAVIVDRWIARRSGHDPDADSGFRFRRFPMLADVQRDVRYAVRMLARTPGFTFVIVLTLALGIGANAAIFSAVDAILLRDAPVADPDRVVSVYASTPDGRGRFASASYPDYTDLRDGGAFEGLAAFGSIAAAFEQNGQAEQVVGEIVTGNYFDVLGVRPALGRGFLPDEDRVGSPVRVAIVSYGFWRQRLGGDPAAVGRPLTFNGNAFTLVGIAPAGFRGHVLGRDPEIFVPMALQPEMRPPTAGIRRQLGSASLLNQRGIGWLNMVGRIPASTTVAGAGASVDVIGRRLEAQYPDSNRGRLFTVVRLGEGPGVRSTARPLLRVLSGAVLLVLLIACANVASLLAARAVARRREVAIRLAVGAARSRLIRQWLTESVLLALVGSIGALLVAWWFTPVLYVLGIPESVALTVDRRVFAFTLTAGVASGLLFGLAPVLQAVRRDTLTALRDDGGAVVSSRRAARMRSAFVVLQVALSLMLMIGAGLFLRTLQNAYAVDLGYDVERMLLADINLDVRGYTPQAGQEVYRQVLERLNGLPGVRAAGASRVPLLSGGARSSAVSTDGRPLERDGRNALGVRVNVISDRYLEALGIPILTGRGFEPSDDGNRSRVVIVSRALANRLWPGQDPVGQFLVGGAPAGHTVVGVAADSVYMSAIERDPPPVYYVPLAQAYESGVTLHVRTAGDPRALVSAVRQVLRAVDPQLVLARSRTLAEDLDRSMGQQRLMATLVGLFGGLALLLAALGLYGVMAHSVGHRRGEIGIRLALGARPEVILSMVVKEGLRLVAIGAALGTAGALAASRVIETQLFGVRPVDPLTYVAVAVVLMLVAITACAIPARRAMRVDPVVVLRTV
jgi:predicted permease